MKLHNCIQGSPEWHELRKRLTASEAQSIAAQGKGLDTLCMETVARMFSKAEPINYTNEDMERGHLLENEARGSFEIETGLMVEEVGFVEMDEYVGASPDGLTSDDGLIEIKCPSDKIYTEYLYTEKIDPKYFAQMQMQMLVTERKHCWYVVYNPNFEKSIVIKRVDWDQTMIDKIVKGLEIGRAKIKDIYGTIQTKN